MEEGRSRFFWLRGIEWRSLSLKVKTARINEKGQSNRKGNRLNDNRVNNWGYSQKRRANLAKAQAKRSSSDLFCIPSAPPHVFHHP